MRKLSDTEKNRLDQHVKLNMENSAANLYGKTERKRLNIDKTKKRVIMCALAMVLFYIFSVLLTCDVTNTNFSLAWVIKHLFRRTNDIVDLITGNHLQSGIHLWLTQFAAPMIAGIALAVSGACFQALFHNAMASPTMLGIESGGTLGKMLFLLVLYTPMLAPLMSANYDGYALEVKFMTIWQQYGEYFLVFAGCMMVVVVLLLISKFAGHGKIQTVPLVVGGTIFSASVNTVLNTFLAYEELTDGNAAISEELSNLQAGAYTSITDPTMLLLFAIPTLLPLPILLLLSGRLNVIAFGEDEAKSMGVSTGIERVVFILLSTIMTAAVVSFCGAISFVGLVIPHIARYIIGQDLKKVLPVSAFLGGIFLLAAFDISYMSKEYFNTGMVVNILGGLIFLVFMIRNRMISGHGSFN